MRNYKIIAIIESKVERWFEDADINTCIIILEKCSGDNKSRERNSNLTRFVYLKKPLRYFIPPAQDMWQKQVERLSAIDKFKKTILAHDDFYENEDLRIFPKSQAELWEEGFDPEQNKYVGSKWGKYIRAPEIFFKILEKGKGKLVPLKQIAEVKFGIKTGARKFFYLTKEQIETLGLEKEVWTHKVKERVIQNYIVTSIRDSKCIEIQPDKLKWRMLTIDKDKNQLKGTNVLRYIKWGERQGFHRRPTCDSRDEWYSLGKVIKAPILSPYAAGDRMIVLYNRAGVFANDNLVHIIPHQENPQIVCALLNSTIFLLMSYVSGVELTGSVNVIKLNPTYTGRIFVVNPKVMTRPLKTKVLKAFQGMLAIPVKNVLDEISLTTSGSVITTKSRKELDEIVMGDILGLTDDEQLEVYRAVVDLVKSRIEKAKSFGKRRKTREGLDIDLFIKTAMDKVGEDTLGKFYREKILSHKPLATKRLPKAIGKVRIEPELFGWRLSWGRQHLDCASEYEARYLKNWLEVGLDSIKMPKDEDYLKGVVPSLEELKKRIEATFDTYLSSIVNLKVQQRLRHQLWQEVIK